MMIFLKEFFEKDDFEKNQQTTNKHSKIPRGRGQGINAILVEFCKKGNKIFGRAVFFLQEVQTYSLFKVSLKNIRTFLIVCTGAILKESTEWL